MAKEIPILMSTPMVQAIMQGRKTQTRRIVKPQPDEDEGTIGVGVFNPIRETRDGEMYPGPDTFGAIADSGEFCVRCPYGQSGDLLWVRETWCRDADTDDGYLYKATNPEAECEDGDGSPWKPSIHMPKAAARIWLQVESVGVERLQDISWDDAVAEGCPGYRPTQDEPTHQFEKLWRQINGPDSWEQNPWVWVVKFSVLSTTGKQNQKG